VTGDGYAVPAALRKGHLVRRQPGSRRAPMRVTSRAFEAAGLPVPEDRSQWNIYRLTRCQGEPWSPQIDRHIARFGGEYLPDPGILCADCDVTLAVDGSVWLDGVRWLADAGLAVGEILDLTQLLAVPTPGDPDRRHGPGWHLWAKQDPDYPIRFGALSRCPAVEIKRRGDIDGVEQLTRYLELLNRDPALSPVRGVFAAQEIRPQARVLAEDRGIRCVTLDYDAMRGAVDDSLRLF